MFETLYEIDKNDKVREWKIWVSGQTIYTEYGLKDGIKIKTSEKIELGKNIGKKNETTPLQQAVIEAESKWKKKHDKGYSTSIKKNIISYFPMLAKDYKKQKHNVKFPCYVQPKLDGYRMVYDGINDRLLSRTGKEYTILENTPLHLELKKFKGVVLDGELYTHDKNFDFENYGVLRKKKLGDGDLQKLSKIVYNVYDTISKEPYKKRLEYISKNIKGFKNISLVPSYICKDINCIDEKYLNFVNDGYEGAMIRNAESLYIGKRSGDLLKYKNFDDAEFEIVGFSKEKDIVGDGSQAIIFRCKTIGGKTFDVPTKGTKKERTIMYKKGNTYIGKKLSVQFFGLTKDGIPRFPKSLRPGESSIRIGKY
jgi:DNA ligase-1